MGVTPSEARKHFYQLMDDVNTTHEPVFISGRKSEAVMIALSDWEAIQETLYLNSIPGMKASILKGMNTSPEDCLPSVDW